LYFIAFLTSYLAECGFSWVTFAVKVCKSLDVVRTVDLRLSLTKLQPNNQNQVQGTH